MLTQSRLQQPKQPSCCLNISDDALPPLTIPALPVSPRALLQPSACQQEYLPPSQLHSILSPLHLGYYSLPARLEFCITGSRKREMRNLATPVELSGQQGVLPQSCGFVVCSAKPWSNWENANFRRIKSFKKSFIRLLFSNKGKVREK